MLLASFTMCWVQSFTPLSDSSVPQSEQPIVLQNHVTVGHPRYVIAHRAMQPDLLDAFPRLRADFGGIFEVVLKKLLHDAHRALVRLVNERIVVKVFVEIIPQLPIQLAPLRTVSHERL